MCQENFFAVIPSSVRYNPRLPHRAVLLYALLTSLAASSGDVFASNAFLSKTLAVTESTVKRLLRALESEKYITVRVTTLDPHRRKIRITTFKPIAVTQNVQALYAVIPAHILSDQTLSPQAKLLYAEIAAATPKNGYCTKSAEAFGKILGASESAVRRSTNELIASSAIRIEYAKAKTQAILYRRLYLTDIAEFRQKTGPGDAESAFSCNQTQPPNDANKPPTSRFSGGVIFAPTPDLQRKSDAEPQIAQKVERKRRKKSVSFSAQTDPSFLFRQVVSFLHPHGVIFAPHI